MARYKLGEIFDLQMGKTPDRHNLDFWTNGSEPWISIADLSKCDKYIEKTAELISQEAVKKSGIKLIPKDTVVMSFKLSIGKVAITPKEMYSNEAIMAFINKGELQIEPTYLYYMLMQHDWDAGTNKAVMGKTLNKATLSQIAVDIHSLAEQREIISVLDKASAVITARRQQLVELDNLIKARFVEMFGECKAYRKFEECLEIKDNMRKPISSAERASMQVGTLYPYYGATGQVGWINDYLSDFDGLCIAEDCGNYHAGEASSYIVRGKIWVNNHAHLLKCVTGVSNLYFINEFFRFADLMDYVNGATRLKLTQSAMKTIPILCPPIELQNQFAAFVEQTDKSKVVVQKALEEAQLLFDSLMQEYFG